KQMKLEGALLVITHKEIVQVFKPGITTIEIDTCVAEFVAKHGETPEQKGFQVYEYATCASMNDEISHVFPRIQTKVNGDLVSIDMVGKLNGGLADSAWTYAVGEIDPPGEKLMEVTKKALYLGIEQAQVGNRIGDIGHAIQTYAEKEGVSVVRDFTGHGIGPTLH